jgi:hypothetical protein
MAIVGIDLGGTNSVIATTEDGRVEVISNREGTRTTPSVVFFQSSVLDDALVGSAAVFNMETDPTRALRGIKRHMGTDHIFLIDGRSYSPVETSAAILKKLKADAEDFLGEPVTDAVITVPAYFLELQREATRKAGELAGLAVRALLAEPIAATIDFAQSQGEELAGKTVMVYDLGGGTFDVTVMTIRRRGIGPGSPLDFSVVGEDVTIGLGGLNWDLALANQVAEDFARANEGKDPRHDPRSLGVLLTRCQRAKEALSWGAPEREVTIDCAHEGITCKFVVSRAKFEELTRLLLQETATKAGQLVQSLEPMGIIWDKIDHVIMVGGSSKMPGARDMLERISGKKLRESRGVDMSVGRGAAYFGFSPEALRHEFETTPDANRMTILSIDAIPRVDTPLPIRPAKSADHWIDAVGPKHSGGPTLLFENPLRSERPWQDELHQLIEYANGFESNYGSYMTDDDRQGLSELIRRSRVALDESDPAEGAALTVALSVAITGSGTAIVLALAQIAIDMAERSQAIEIARAKVALERAYEDGNSSGVTEISNALKSMLYKVLGQKGDQQKGDPPPGHLSPTPDSADTCGGSDGEPVYRLPSITGLRGMLQHTNFRGNARLVPARPITDLVHFSAFAPLVVMPKSRFLLSLWAYLEGQREQMLVRALQADKYLEVGSKGLVQVDRGTVLTIGIDLPGFEVEEATDDIRWEGRMGNASFPITVPMAIDAGTHLGRARILCGGVQIARLSFAIEVGADVGARSALETEVEAIRSIFASYASEDRVAVLHQWGRGARAVGVDVFVDVLSLREGQHWEKQILEQIRLRDLFCLFWSEAASKSPWVEKEWKCALSTRGLDYIHPVPLVDPAIVPPPSELGASKHFNDLSRIVIDYETARKGS